MKLFSIKPAPQAYTSNMLPKNRKEVFFDILRLHWGKFFWMGMLAFLFSLPIHLCVLFCDWYAASYDSNAVTADQIQQSIIRLQNLRMIINIPLLMVLAVPMSGIMRIVRQYAWGENVFFSYDFPKGIRQNAAQALAVAFIGGFTFMLAVICFRTAAAKGSTAVYIAFIPLGIFLLLIFPLCCYIVAAIPVYSNSLLSNMKTALFVYSKKPFKTLLVLACLLAVFLLSYVPNVYFHIFGRIIGSFSIPVLLFAWILFCYEQFDRYINLTEHPELIGKGILGLKYGDR